MSRISKLASLGILLIAAGLAYADAPTLSSAMLRSPIAPQPLATALQNWARQLGVQVMYPTQLATGVESQGAPAGLSANQALEQILAGTGLQYRVLNDRTVSVVREGDARQPLRNLSRGAASGHGGDGSSGGAMRFAQAGNEQATSEAEGVSGQDAEGSTQDSSEGSEQRELEEVVVTGTHIRGTDHSVGAHVISLDEEEIKKGGFSSVQDVVRSLPQNFKGGISEDSIDQRNPNPERGTALNLRGLGFGATLTLLNGRRIAAGGSNASFTDVSFIPVTAIEKIDILADGASALYGADAIGGVVNIVLKKKYEGAATQMRLGSVTSGSLQDYFVGQNLGKSWANGNALVAAEYRYRDALPASARREMDSDLRPHGGDDFRQILCNPGTIQVGSQRYAIPQGQDGTSLTPQDFPAAGTTNKCNRSVGTNILSQESRWTIFAASEYRVVPTVELFANAGFTNREVAYGLNSGTFLFVPDANAFYVNPAGGTGTVVVLYDWARELPFSGAYTGRSVNAAVGARIRLQNTWQLTTDFSGSFSDQDGVSDLNPDPTILAAALADSNPATAFNPFADGSNTNPETLASLRDSAFRTYSGKSESMQMTAIADGPLFELPGGEVKLALGAEKRWLSADTQTTDWRRSISAPTIFPLATFDRSVNAAFAELFLPVVGQANRRRGLERFQISAAGRYESYTDYGDTFVPKLGFRLTPWPELSLRGTWSKAFRAPHATELLEGANQWEIYDAPSPTGTGMSAVLRVGGGNKDLTEETAKVWTFGLDWTPTIMSGLSISLGYFNVDFTNRIGALANTDLSDPTNAGAIVASPTAEQRDIACRAPRSLGNNSTIAPGDCLTAAVDYLMDLRARNQASVSERGVDLHGSYLLPVSHGDLNIGVNASYLLEYTVKQSTTAPGVAVLDIAGNPIAFRLRGELGWSRQGLGVTAFVNYADGYEYPATQPGRRLASSTTFDLNVGYNFRHLNTEVLKDLQLSLNVQNLFDKAPSFYNNPAGMAYDPANADLLGRFVSLYLRKDW